MYAKFVVENSDFFLGEHLQRSLDWAHFRVNFGIGQARDRVEVTPGELELVQRETDCFATECNAKLLFEHPQEQSAIPPRAKVAEVAWRRVRLATEHGQLPEGDDSRDARFSEHRLDNASVKLPFQRHRIAATKQGVHDLAVGPAAVQEHQHVRSASEARIASATISLQNHLGPQVDRLNAAFHDLAPRRRVA